MAVVLFTRLPEVANESVALKRLAYVLRGKGIIVVVCSCAPNRQDHAQALIHAYRGALELRVLLFPLFDVFFRTEERHVVSGVCYVVHPSAEGDAEMKEDGVRLLR